ncbi:MAG: hypothetical protein EF807_00500 [Candidatus Methanolliviera hydrocarbonicum]|uniref:DUF2069 domain-containing protein n=1 Tax=Candidatus Methanolliviera hydrocarbonicum TaxID=2491085 RepID=A0A520KYU2_9EURY|nr:MAG: hypothetical protein EF807_00500 [Candidatus Methanolliviera hydrocarbonicum]
MENVLWKARVFALWILMTLAFLSLGVLNVLGSTEAMHLGTGMRVLWAIFFLVPMIMAFLSLILKDPANRWTNLFMVLLFFNVCNVCNLQVHLIQPRKPDLLLIICSMIVFSVLIIWYSWK